MNRIISRSWALALVAVSALAFIGCDTAGGAAASTGGGASAGHATSVDGAEAQRLVAQGATLLDVRTTGEWEGGHLEGAVLIPIRDLEARLAEIPRDKAVVVYCASGARSARAAAILSGAGYTAHDLGGMSNWGG